MQESKFLQLWLIFSSDDKLGWDSEAFESFEQQQIILHELFLSQ